MIKDYLKFTDNTDEQVSIAKRLIQDVTRYVDGHYEKFYTPQLLNNLNQEILHYDSKLSDNDRDILRYRFIYDYWIYGCTVDEEYYLGLKDLSDAEKRKYMVRQIRNVYVNYLNKDAGPNRIKNLSDKYNLYKILTPYFKREMIEISSVEDLPIFTSFVKKNKEFVVKPSDCSFGFGVHKFTVVDDNYADALLTILKEGQEINENNPSKARKMVLEELIIQDKSLSEIHSNSVNGIRATAVRGKDGNIHIYHPWIKVGVGGAFVASAAFDGFDAEIDADSGIVISDGYQENGNVYSVHPDSGIKIKGFKIPKWNELIQMVNEIMSKLPGYGYIGWDLVLTPDGWCVMEGNYSGEFIFQLINGCGFKEDFENLIGWKYNKDFWWENHSLYKHN